MITLKLLIKGEAKTEKGAQLITKEVKTWGLENRENKGGDFEKDKIRNTRRDFCLKKESEVLRS